jgi:hypothetical protein
MRAMAEGHSFNLCNNAILYSYEWALDQMLQSMDRVHRLNSRKAVNIYPIVCKGSIDRKLESMLDEKDDSSELVLDGQLMNEAIEEVNLFQLLKIAHQEFTADKALPEDECRAQWPSLCARLTEATAALAEKTPEQIVQQETREVVTEALLAPIEKIMEVTAEPRWLNWSRRFRFT